MSTTVQPSRKLGDNGIRRASPERQRQQRAERRNARALERMAARQTTLIVPPPVSEVPKSRAGMLPKLSAEALELARQVYYLQYGSRFDAARAIAAAGLATVDEDAKQDAVTIISQRLQTWWRRAGWPSRSIAEAFAIRDAMADGGLYRGRQCAGICSGNGPAREGKRCEQSALTDSEFCAHHDPRPKYEQRRRMMVKRFARSRAPDMVDSRPLIAWMDEERKRLLADARARGDRIDPKDEGWRRLSAHMGVNQSLIKRTCDGQANGARARSNGAPLFKMRATTIVRYLEPTGVSFRDVYGYDPPIVEEAAYRRCQCGQPKTAAAKMCLDCYERSGDQCLYVNRAGVQCTHTTRRASGYCNGCEKIVTRGGQRINKAGRPGGVTTEMLMLALERFAQTPNLARVARELWELNAEDAREVFLGFRSLETALVRYFRQQEWHYPNPDARTMAQVAAMLEDMQAEHGPACLPSRPRPVRSHACHVPSDRFRRWVLAQHERVCLAEDRRTAYGVIAGRLCMNVATLSEWHRGIGAETIHVAVVKGYLRNWGEGAPAFTELYAGYRDGKKR